MLLAYMLNNALPDSDSQHIIQYYEFDVACHFLFLPRTDLVQIIIADEKHHLMRITTLKATVNQIFQEVKRGHAVHVRTVFHYK